MRAAFGCQFRIVRPSRLVFILTNFFVFFLAYEIAVAFFLRRTLGFEWNKALIASLAANSLIPPLWLPPRPAAGRERSRQPSRQSRGTQARQSRQQNFSASRPPVCELSFGSILCKV
jgi:hypothetical protein